MNPPKTDAEYHDAIRELLGDIELRLTQPCWMPLSQEQQISFLHLVLNKGYAILNSEPHLRGAVIQSCAKVKELDFDRITRELNAYRLVAAQLLDTHIDNGDKSPKQKRDAIKAAVDAAHKAGL